MLPAIEEDAPVSQIGRFIFIGVGVMSGAGSNEGNQVGFIGVVVRRGGEAVSAAGFSPYADMPVATVHDASGVVFF